MYVESKEEKLTFKEWLIKVKILYKLKFKSDIFYGLTEDQIPDTGLNLYLTWFFGYTPHECVLLYRKV